MPLFCDAYLGDTMHLSLEEHGAYLKLLMITWRNNGQPLPDDDARIARMLGVTPARWRDKLRPSLASFFDLSEGYWRQNRLEKEWIFTQKLIEKNRANGSKGGRAKSLNNRNADLAMGSSWVNPNETQRPSTQTQTHKSTTLPPPYQDAPHEGGGGGSMDGSTGKGEDAAPPPRDAVPAADPDTEAVCEAFRRLVAETWPGAVAVPSASMRREAREYLDQGATVALLVDVMAAGMARARDQGKGAVRSLRFFRHSIPEAIAQAKAGKAPAEAQPGLTGATDWQPTVSLDEVDDGWRRRVARLMPGGAVAYGRWIATLPEPTIADGVAVFVEESKFRRSRLAEQFGQFLAGALGVKRVDFVGVG
jgi:uncharacterized protein YdaU (DUF1376 family)